MKEQANKKWMTDKSRKIFRKVSTEKTKRTVQIR